MILTATSRYQPVRTICARPKAFVDLQAQRRFGVSGIEADDGKTTAAQIER